jgi:MerR family transcriptional regulator, heat shock protein HspR
MSIRMLFSVSIVLTSKYKSNIGLSILTEKFPLTDFKSANQVEKDFGMRMDGYNCRICIENRNKMTKSQKNQEDSNLFTIGEAADLIGISVQTLRYYEQQGLIIPFHRGSKHRRYSNHDIERIKCMRTMINQEKVSIEGIKRLLSLIPCWNIKGCSMESRVKCDAYQMHSTPCWMVTNKSKECKNAECRLCPVYTEITDCNKLKRVITDNTSTPIGISTPS